MMEASIRDKGLPEWLIGPEELIASGLRQMDESGQKVLYVVDEDQRLLGVATDGDIRRWLIGGRKLDEPVGRVMNPKPQTLRAGHTVDEAKQLLLAHKIDMVPVLDGHGRVVDSVSWHDLFGEREVVLDQVRLPVVIMAGGEGSRLSPFTKVLPKPLLPVGETPILELIIERFSNVGCDQFYLSVNYKANLIKAYFNDLQHDYHVEYVEEDKPLGTAGSLALLAGKLKETFFVSNCDILIDADYADILRFHREQGNKVTVVASAKHFAVPYGVCEVSESGGLSGINEKPEFDFLVSTGMYVLEPDVLGDIPDDGIYHVTDLINDYARRGLPLGIYPVSEAAWLDMGQWEEFQHMRTRLGMV